jgi:hypothetical protein
MAGRIIFILLFFLVEIIACKKKTPEQTRSFYMGITPWPADFTQLEVDNAYLFINNNCDLVSHHFDEGIPYEEAYTNSNWPAGLIADIQIRKTKTIAGKKIFLSSSALNLTRKEKSDYYRFSDNISAFIKNQWIQLPVNDPKVITAYVNYVSYLVTELNPAFINYGVESNVESWNASDFLLYKDFLSKVYVKLKAAFPTIPVMISFIVNETPQSLNFASQLISYSDYLSLSAYPYTHISSSANGNTYPSLFPASYFTNYFNLANGKPFGFAETGFIAEDLVIPSFNLNKQGNEQWQKDYIELICKLTNERNGKFIIWFCSKDYDAGNNTLRTLGLYQDLLGLWEDTGLLDENNKQRLSFKSWANWIKRKKKN